MSPDFRTAALIAATLGLLVSVFLAVRSDGGDDPGTTTPALTAPATTEPSPTEPRP